MKSLTKETLKIFWQHATRYKISLSLVLFGVLGITATELYVPFLFRNLFNGIAEGNKTNGKELFSIITLITIFYGIQYTFRRIQEFTNITLQSKILRDLPITCFNYMADHSYSFFSNNFVGSLVRKVNKYTRAFEDIADEVVYRLGRTIILIVGILTVLFIRHWALGLGLLIWTVLYVSFNIWFARYKLKYDIRRAKLDTKTTGRLADSITNNINVKLFSSKKAELKGYEDLNEELHQARTFTWRLDEYSNVLQSILLYALEIGLMIVAINLWLKGVLTLGDFALLQAYIFQIIIRIWDVTRFMRNIYQSLADANEMTEILLTPHKIQDAPNAKNFEVTNGKIELKNIYFEYKKNQTIFDKFNLKMSANEKLALIGPSGGGKTTIVKLLFRFFDLQKGQILIDGQDISKVTQDSLRNNLSLVPQDPILFHRPLIENIRYAKPNATKTEVTEAAKKAYAHEFISALPEGYSTFVGERGIKLSGGERQRVAIARAILKNSPILVLDEATSSLDSESEMYIQDALKSLMKNKTVIVIAHRLSTIMQMDRIVVIDGGKIVEEGKHEELLKAKQGTYQRLWQIQAGGFA
ncbi:MAG: hypothetical protein COT92_02995 [Candidatus Doudnabacteria bacterium CG10_big_fil_rev_8_21_14_0_10_42_18]|uniref:ABC transporter ATP-binding protein n=1 Tax=Candidatus Doudnabacteria bacterium CG10_big_fil_rev_8_21_14_0_10_42_18 TaxID=1974552 RepID=A0A2H0VAF1_9BACT|nr:MAG: hypothetical protein COT92_02995 [Candidatus Doudnabacteria bacterium CG10_big_fil_rev_8_21_14_0_10_42_18]